MTPIFTRPQRSRRDVRKPIAFFAVLGIISLVFTLVSATILGRRYQDMRQYMQDMPCARPNDFRKQPPALPDTGADDDGCWSKLLHRDASWAQREHVGNAVRAATARRRRQNGDGARRQRARWTGRGRRQNRDSRILAWQTDGHQH